MHVATTDLPLEMEVGAIRTHGADMGGQLVRYLSLPPGTDFTPLFKGLPGDACQCAHWGYVIEGSITVKYADGTEETTQAGETYYWPGGHVGWTTDGVRFLEISPTADITPVLEHVGAQLANA